MPKRKSSDLTQHDFKLEKEVARTTVALLAAVRTANSNKQALKSSAATVLEVLEKIQNKELYGRWDEIDSYILSLDAAKALIALCRGIIDYAVRLDAYQEDVYESLDVLLELAGTCCGFVSEYIRSEYETQEGSIGTLMGSMLLDKKSGKLSEENEIFFKNLIVLLLGFVGMQSPFRNDLRALKVCQILFGLRCHSNFVNLAFKPNMLRVLCEIRLRIDARVPGDQEAVKFFDRGISYNELSSGYNTYGIYHGIWKVLSEQDKAYLEDTRVKECILDFMLCTADEIEVLTEYGRQEVLKSVDSEMQQYDKNQSEFGFSMFLKGAYTDFRQGLVKKIQALEREQNSEEEEVYKNLRSMGLYGAAPTHHSEGKPKL